MPAAGIALILGVDRPLDMARTAAHITGYVTVAAIVAAGEGQLAPVGASTDPGGAVAAPSTTL